MAGINIRDSYKQWLIKQGLKTETPSKHSSTVTEYLRRIDRICDKHYKRHDATAWNKLTKNIQALLISYHECQTKEYLINKQNIDAFLKYFNDISNSNQITLNLRVKLSFICQKESQFITITTFKELISFVSVFKGILNIAMNINKLSEIHDVLTFYKSTFDNVSPPERQISLYQNAIEKLSCGDSLIENLVLHVEYMNEYKAKSLASLNKFYTFLSNPPANDNNPTSLHLVKLKEDRNDDKINNCLIIISGYRDNFMKCLTQTNQTGSTALQIKAHSQTGGYLRADEVANVFGIDPKTLWRLKKDELFMPDFETFYHEDRINQYLQEHFHRAQPPYSDVDYSRKNLKWHNRRDVARILGVAERTILNYTKKGILTYTDYAPKAPRYYPPEIEFLANKRS